KFARGRLRFDVYGGALELRGFHLTCDGADPNQLVEPGLIRFEEAGDVAWAAREARRADRFVRLLRVLGLVLVDARRFRNVGGAEIGFDHAARGGNGAAVELDAVSSHIGDEADGIAVDVDALV